MPMSEPPGEIAEVSAPVSREFWSRFKTDPMAIAGLFGIGLLMVGAVFAPLLANERPFVFYREGRLSFPILRYLFAPDTNEVVVEQIFNYLLIALPVMLLAWILFRKRPRVRIVVSCVLGVLLMLPFFFAEHVLDRTDWREDAKRLAEGDFAIFAPVPYGPFENIAQPFSAPSREHIFGTDKIGRDVFSRMLYGARVSLAVGMMATFIAMVLGTSVGLVSGYLGGKTDMVLMRIVEVVICFPTFLLLLILMAILQDRDFRQSILLVIGVIGFTSWTGLSRIVRGETLKLRPLAYIQSCESLAIPVWRIMLLHILPNIAGPIMISFSFGVAGAIVAESSLSFLGFGVQPPTASWGELLRQAMEDPFIYWHLTLWPGVALFIAVVSFNFAGEGLRKALDPKN
ncbi:MAG: ABC transporter permease [Victivallales bacterium]|nr:ABC transporter permease [Victivallales bacterium]